MLVFLYNSQFILYCALQAITASGTKQNDLILGEIHSQLRNKNIAVDIKANSDANVSYTFDLNYSCILIVFNLSNLHGKHRVQLFCTTGEAVLSKFMGFKTHLIFDLMFLFASLCILAFDDSYC